MTDHDASRLTDEDRATMRARVADKIRGYSRFTPWMPGSADNLILERIAAHAIGCGFDDLRPVELDEIRALVATAIDNARKAENRG